MERGKKSVAERVVYGALEEVQTKLKQDPVPAFHEALENVKPAVEVRSRRVGGATYQVPVEVRPERRQALAIRWIIQAARDRRGAADHGRERLSARAACDGSAQRAAATAGQEARRHRTAHGRRQPSAFVDLPLASELQARSHEGPSE